MSDRFSRRRIRLSYANVVATLALVLAMSGGAIAATHYLITSTKQISPRVLKKLKGFQGVAVAVHNDTGFSTTDPMDQMFHTIATLPVSQTGSYVATAKVSATTLGGAGGQAIAQCRLVARSSSGTDVPDSDQGFSYLSTFGDEQTLALELTHRFGNPGTIVLQCTQNGTFPGGAFLRFDLARIIAIQVSSLTDTAVTS
jgi:hypothetical protein